MYNPLKFMPAFTLCTFVAQPLVIVHVFSQQENEIKEEIWRPLLNVINLKREREYGVYLLRDSIQYRENEDVGFKIQIFAIILILGT